MMAAMQAPRSALPIGAQPTTDPLRVGAVELSKELEHNVLAVSYAQTEEEVATRWVHVLPMRPRGGVRNKVHARLFRPPLTV